MKLDREFNNIVNEVEDIRVKEYEIRKTRVETQYEDMQRRQKEQERNKNLDVSKLDDEQKDKIKGSIKDYMHHAKRSQIFLNDDFKGKVPMFARNLVFIGGESGNGKSTITANLAYSAIIQRKKVLVITNEEHTSDVFNRISCMIKGWNYSSDHSEFTDSQIDYFMEMIDKLSPYLNVIDDNYGGSTGVTTTVEGISSILDKLVNSEVSYDLIVIDYYQNVDFSSKNPELNEFQVQERFARYLDSFKNRYHSPIILLGQLKPDDEEKTPFKLRIEGRKVVYNVSTTCIEVKRDTANSRSKFIIRKSRFPACLGEEIHVGYDRGKFVKYNNEFALSVEARKQEKVTREILDLKMRRNEGQ
jgi:archaellum biogenesis ATPase FlaH